MKHLCTILATVFAAAFTASAKTFDWPIDSPAAKAAQFTAYHGETVRFNLRLGGAMTNLSPVAIYYQTNGMGKAEWFGPVPGTVFHPTNDCGAAAYRFFILCNDPDGKDYTANGSLRLLDSPGFEPSAVQLPVRSLDFAKIEVLNPPWGEGPGNYAAVSNAAMTAAQTATNLVAAATNGIPTRADLDKGWWSEWTFSNVSASITDIQQPVFNVDYWSCGCMYSGELLFMWIEDAKETDTRLDFSFTAGGNDLHFTATRHRVAAPVPTKPEDIGAASTADAALAPVFGEWTILRDGGDVTRQVRQPEWDEEWVEWLVDVLPSEVAPNPTIPGMADASYLTWTAYDETGDDYNLVTYTATRSLIGYTLGSQTDKPLASLASHTSLVSQVSAIGRAATNYTVSAIAEADTSYRRFTAVTNVNQTVQFVELDETQTSLAIELPSSGDTKDWLVYVYAATNATLSLPSGVTWWTPDAANTNAIDAATPTALYFSQVSTNIFMFGRQTLMEVSP